jgi:hypothetical protein
VAGEIRETGGPTSAEGPFWALAGAPVSPAASRPSKRAARRRQEVSLHTDKHGDVNLNVDIERNGKLVGREAGLKVPVGKTTRLQLALNAPPPVVADAAKAATPAKTPAAAKN